MADEAQPKGRFLGSLRDALAAASREDTTKAATALPATPPVGALPPPVANKAIASQPVASQPAASKGEPPVMADRPSETPPAVPSAAEAAREARGGTPNIPPVDRHIEGETTRFRRAPVASPAATAARTQLVRGKQKVSRQQFVQDPVVGWLVIVGGPGLGAHRPIYEGNNTVGRSANQRVPLDFGDDAISSEEQAYIRYDSAERSFLFVPNMAKTNVVAINDKRPTTAVTLHAMDVIMMGRTQLVFVPFCGPEFDWSVIADAAEK